jgi:hypothetical protein
MMRFTPAAEAFLSTSTDAIAVVAIPLTGVEGSPALNPSGEFAGASPPRASLILWMTSSAVSGAGEAAVEATVPAMSPKRLRVIECIGDDFNTQSIVRYTK